MKGVRNILDKWTGEVVGTMHIYRISSKRLAERIGVTNRYLSAILNCKKRPKDCESRVRQALNELIQESGDGFAEAEMY